MIGKFKGLWLNPEDKTVDVMLSISGYEVRNLYEQLKDKTLDIVIKAFRAKRSNDANALMWKCLTEIGYAMNPPADKWFIYLKMLKRYGQHTYICARPDAVDNIRKQWRETEVVGEININGEKAIQMLCYYGSSTLNTKEFSILLNGIISEMEQMGIPTPSSAEMRRTLEQHAKSLLAAEKQKNISQK